MNLIPWVWAAGAVHLLVASANFFAARELRYRDNLQKVTPIIRDIFYIQNLYIVLTLVASGLLCFAFAPELTGSGVFGRVFSGLLAGFWGLRIGMQLFFYNAESKRKYPVINAGMLAVFVYLCGVFTLAALGLGA